MKIAFKIVAVCLVAMILITALSSWLIARRAFQRVKQEQQSDAARVVELIRESVDVAYRTEGHQGIVKAIRTQTVESGRVRYRWVWFDVAVNDPNSPSASLDTLNHILKGKMDSVVTKSDGRSHLHTYYPLGINDDSGATRPGALEVTGSLDRVEQETWKTIYTGLAAIGLMALVCVVAVSWAGIRMIGRPLSELIAQTQKIGNGVYDEPMIVQTDDEFGVLATALNEMSEKISRQQTKIENESTARVETVKQLRHADRLKTVGRLAAGLAHEIGTPLNVVSGRAGLIRSGKLTTAEIEESAAAIQSESDRIAAIVRQLMDFARHNQPDRTAIDLRIVVNRTVELLKTLADKNGVTMEIKLAGDGPFTAFVDASQIQQVLTNLVVNAIQEMPAGGQIEIELENNIAALDGEAPQDFVIIDVRDHGSGMDEETQQQIFEPFFTTKEIGQGTGLGLSIAHGIVEEHQGQIEVESEVGVGTEFRVWLPKSQ